MKLSFSTWFVSSLLLLLPLSSGAVKYNKLMEDPAFVKVRGEVTDLHLLEEDRGMISWELKLKLKIVNEGTKSAILLRQDLQIGSVMLAENAQCATGGDYIYKRAAWPSVYTGPEWERWRKQVDSAEPKSSHTWILIPGQSMSFDARTVLNIEKGGNFDRTNKRWEEIRNNTRCLQVQIKPWPVNLEPNHDPQKPEFGEALRDRWRSFGELQLSILTSEPIPLTFPK